MCILLFEFPTVLSLVYESIPYKVKFPLQLPTHNGIAIEKKDYSS